MNSKTETSKELPPPKTRTARNWATAVAGNAQRSRGRGKKNLELQTRGATKNLHVPLDQGNFVVFDIETTGGNPEKNGITEIFAIRYRYGKIIDTFYSMVNPEILIPPIVRKMTGITNRMVKDSPKIYEIMPDFVKFVGPDILVSHNTIGDMKFLRYYSLKTCGKMMPNYYLCTHLLVEKLLPEAPDKSLKGLSKFLSLKTSGDLHRAESDAYLSLELFKVLLVKLENKSIADVIDGIRFQGDYESGMRLGWAVKNELLANLPNQAGVFLLLDREKKVTFLSGVADLEKDVRKMNRLNSLPRQLLKSVLASCSVETKAASDPVDAAIEESKLLCEHSIRFNPGSWHQKTANFLFLYKDQNKHWISSGNLVTNTIFAVGPIRGGKEASVFLDDLSQVLEHKVSRRGIPLSKWEFHVILEILGGKDISIKEGLKRLPSLAWPFSQESIDAKLNMENKIHQLNPPANLPTLDKMTGVLYIESGDRSYLYVLKHGLVCGKRELVKGRKGLHEREELEKMLASCEKMWKKPKIWPLSHFQALAISRLAWWAHFGEKSHDCRFFSIHDLKSLIAEKPPLTKFQ